MKNRKKTIIIILLLIIISVVLDLIFIDNNKYTDNRKVANNVENNIQENSSNITLEQWKKDQIKNYKFATNLKF